LFNGTGLDLFYQVSCFLQGLARVLHLFRRNTQPMGGALQLLRGCIDHHNPGLLGKRRKYELTGKQDEGTSAQKFHGMPQDVLSHLDAAAA
jgi:hypothetical protein